MTMTSQILKDILKTAKGMHKAGTMDDKTFREFQRLCKQETSENKAPKKSK